mmetsp:Transcript_11871/g.17913  ORF Transcript_11871/g.17913 Transcript_11871/m.17913 type:complete len:138 (+) Transcript_11871:1616-2029(+)
MIKVRISYFTLINIRRIYISNKSSIEYGIWTGIICSSRANAAHDINSAKQYWVNQVQNLTRLHALPMIYSGKSPILLEEKDHLVIATIGCRGEQQTLKKPKETSENIDSKIPNTKQHRNECITSKSKKTKAFFIAVL